jgi:hypothetical protein
VISVVGPDWPSKRKLEAYCSTLEVGPTDVLVNWGSSQPGGLNSMGRLNAVDQLTCMREGGVEVPDFTTDRTLALHWVKEGHLVFGRSKYHTQGRDIVGPGRRAPLLYNREWLNREWWSKVVPNVESEWRIHICRRPNGEYSSIARGLKVQVGEPWRVMPVRSRNNGWHMAHDVKPPEQVREAARSAVRSLGYDFAGVDVLWTNDNRAVVLEANTACGLDDYTCSRYGKAFVEWTQ